MSFVSAKKRHILKLIMSYKRRKSIEDAINPSGRSLEDQIDTYRKQDRKSPNNSMSKFVSTLASIDSDTPEAKENETSIDDNNGERIKLNEDDVDSNNILGDER